jgi:hypothetical protein
MDHPPIEFETNRIANQIPPGPRLAVIGSASFHGRDSEEICLAVGARVAEIEDLVLLTGGVPGVGEAIGRTFWGVRRQASVKPNVFHILPRGSARWDYGTTLQGGSTMLERREILGRLARVYLAIEGGPGTAHEARIVQSQGGTLVPVGRTGGYSEELYGQLVCPKLELAPDWRKLGDSSAATEQVAAAVRAIVEELLGQAG